MLYESFEDSPQRELAYVLDVTSGATSSFDVFQRSFAWDGQQHVVVGPRMTDPSTTYDSTGQPISIVPARGTATLRDLQAQPVDSWSNVGQLVAGAPDGSAVALSDEEFTDAYSFVSVFRNGQRTDIEPLPVDGYIATYCAPAALAPGGAALAVSCSLIERGADAGYGATFLHPL